MPQQPPPDPFHLQRFVDAQAAVWDQVQRELRAGRKTTHWIWFIFPQLADLGRSHTARFYGISGAEEARAFLAHPLLGPRLLEACQLLLRVTDASAREVLGEVDAMKVRSCLTLFDAVAPQQAAFRQCLDRFYAGETDPLTTSLLRDAD